VARSREYFENWVCGNWHESNQQLIALPGKGYAVVESIKKDTNSSVTSIVEFRSADSAAERDLVSQLIHYCARRGHTVRLEAAPQFNEPASIGASASRPSRNSEGMMIRNIGLMPDEYAAIKDLYRTGRATWWLVDHV
jgi:hypothetical protein